MLVEEDGSRASRDSLWFLLLLNKFKNHFKKYSGLSKIEQELSVVNNMTCQSQNNVTLFND